MRAPGATQRMTSGLNQIENVIGPPGDRGGGGVPVIGEAGAVEAVAVNGAVGGVSGVTPEGAAAGGGVTTGGAAGRPGTVKVPAQRGHFINCPAYCSSTASVF